MNILIIDNGTKYLSQLTKLTSSHQVVIKNYSKIVDSDSTSFDLIILSGGHNFSVLGNEQLFKNEFQLVQNTSTPILGICFGFELISYVYGATMLKMESKESGILELEQIQDDPIFAGISAIKVYESHRWVVTKVDENLIALAKSRDGVEVIKHKSKLIYGFQFHPEMFEDITQGNEIFANFINIVQNRYT